MRKPPFDPRTGRHLPLYDSRIVEAFEVEQLGHNSLLCRDTRGQLTVVAKPWPLRKQEYDGETIGGVAYTAGDVIDEREANDDGVVEAQRVTPAYAVGEVILAARRPQRVLVEVGDDGGYAAEWEDLNVAGRCWSQRDATFAVQVEKDGGVAGDADTSTDCSYTYTVNDMDGNELATGITPQVARYGSAEYAYAGEGGSSTYGVATWNDSTLLLLSLPGEYLKSTVCP